MKIRFFYLIFLFFFTTHIIAQSSPDTNANNYSCSSDSDLPPSCPTYVSYFAQSPEFLNLESISRLFGINRSEIANASNLKSEDRPLFPHQLLLIPIKCGCDGTHYLVNITYQIKQLGENYFLLSTNSFENLTNWHAVQDANPSLKPTLLHVGDNVTFPLLCKCPSKKNLENGIKHLISYVWQPMDDVMHVASMFSASSDDIISENSYYPNMSNATYLPISIPVSKLPMLSQPYPTSENRKSKRLMTLIILKSLGGSLLIFVIVTGAVYTRRWYRKKKSSLETAELMIKMKDLDYEKSDCYKPKILPGVSGYLGKPVMYEKKVILESTMNFNESCRIGGSVYKGMLNGQILAVKKTKEDVREEIMILQRVNHVNLVKLMGFSLNNIDVDCFLVYEYAENGSLDKWLYSNSLPFLSWTQRLHIALDVANGLQYLHEHIQPNIVHRDIRTDNILVGLGLKAKIANFSMARPATNSVSPKVDVFGFGIVLLEILSGKKSMETKENGEVVMLWKEVREVLDCEEEKEERLREWMDPNLGGLYPIDGALSLAGLAKACTYDLPLARPSIAEIVFNLSVLAQTSPFVQEKSWVSSLEEAAEDVSHNVNPLTAR
uniref:LysM receptor n=1 Tax=Datisca glomerata TaxID=34297 RepID=A0A3Q8TKP4_DATGL|nr:LysM receptor [Datisca glomerata]